MFYIQNIEIYIYKIFWKIDSKDQNKHKKIIDKIVN